MTHVFLERRFATPLTAEAVLAISLRAGDCLDRHRVTWLGSLLAQDGRRMFCHFQAPDAESTRTALYQALADPVLQQAIAAYGAEIRGLWPGTVHEAADLDASTGPAANVLVERHFEAPVTVEAIQQIEDAGAACLDNHRVRFVRSFFARNRQRMVCLYRAPDAESVRLAQRQAGMPMTRVWAFHAVPPPHPTGSHATS
ncbi:DUF4242 domain-containing protein [Halomonas sp. NO4]|uniref:DUF4242 domain-containing protein n=1 Tax=Halomonas sp. NO4 TaxID=2484813 RepID=UPI0013CFBD23|nr:DUF4242 domain-containing protein [Halomonas sp. NO4]